MSLLGAKRACLAQAPSGWRTSHSFPYDKSTSARGTSTKTGTSCADVDVTHILWGLAVFPLSQYRNVSRSYAANQSPSLFYLRGLPATVYPAVNHVYQKYTTENGNDASGSCLYDACISYIQLFKALFPW